MGWTGERRKVRPGVDSNASGGLGLRTAYYVIPGLAEVALTGFKRL